MKWEITKISDENSSLVVTLTCGTNKLQGTWAVKRKPSVGNETYIEIDISVILDELEVSESIEKTFNSRVLNGVNIFNSLVESIDREDFVHCLRLTEDLLILIDSEEIELKEGSFYMMKVPIEMLKVFPC